MGLLGILDFPGGADGKAHDTTLYMPSHTLSAAHQTPPPTGKSKISKWEGFQAQLGSFPGSLGSFKHWQYGGDDGRLVVTMVV